MISYRYLYKNMFNLNDLPNKLKDEQIVLIIRRDFIIFALIIFKYIFLAIVPIFAKFLIIDYIFPNFTDSYGGVVIATILTFSYYLYIWLFFYRAFIDYFLDMWIVTNQRILSIKLKGLFNRTVAKQKLNRIQDITTEQKGFMAHFFNYGNIYIQTAGTVQRFVFEQVPDPNKITHQINKLVEWNKKAFPDNV